MVAVGEVEEAGLPARVNRPQYVEEGEDCLLYTSDAADDSVYV